MSGLHAAELVRHSKEKVSQWGSSLYTLSDMTEARTKVGDEPTMVAASRQSIGIGAAKKIKEPVKGLWTHTACGESLAARTKEAADVGGDESLRTYIKFL